ncbi:MAG TPA: hypothetical protein VF989_17965 [Polyangiaceae bacterium]
MAEVSGFTYRPSVALSNRKKLVVILFAALLALAAAAFFFLWFWVRPEIKAHVVRSARERGIELSFRELELGPGAARFGGVEFRLIGVSGFSGSASALDVALDGIDPERFTLEEARLAFAGSLARLGYELGAFAHRYPDAFSLPLEARDVGVDFKPDPNAPAALVVRDGVLEHDGKITTFSAPDAVLLGRRLGRVGASWSRDERSITFGFGESDPEKAPLAMSVDYEKATASMRLSPMPTERLGALLGVRLPLSGVQVSAESALDYGIGAPAGGAKGDFTVTLDGYVPPHPRELDGFVFGKQTRFSTSFEYFPTERRVALDDSSVKAGRFELKGGGSAVIELTTVNVRLDLLGHLSCVALAGAAAESYLGHALGRLAGKLAEQTLRGTVAVVVKIEASTSDLDNARVLRTIGVGCGLKPIELPTLGDWFGSMPDLGPNTLKLPTLPSGFPPMPSGMPPMPSGMPTLPPRFEVPRLDFPPALPGVGKELHPAGPAPSAEDSG